MIQFHEGDVVRKLREKRKISRQKLAKMAGMRAATLGRIEKTGKYRPEKLKDLSKILGSSESEILSLVPVIMLQPAPLQPNIGICNDPEHMDLLRRTDQALHDGISTRAMELGMLALMEMLSPSPKGKDFSAEAPIRTSDPIGPIYLQKKRKGQ